MEYRMVLNDDSWPKSFKHLVQNSLNDEIYLRSNISCIDDIGKWISEFGRLTRTQWNLRQSKPSGTYVVCMRKFVCHHSSFHKVDKHRNKKGCSKNDGCNASISISVQVYSKRMRVRKNPMMEAGLWAKIRISTVHTHSLDTITALRNLQDRNGDLRNKFFGYFINNMSACEAKNYHESILKENGSTETDLLDGRRNPKARTISYWYEEWKKLNCNCPKKPAFEAISSKCVRKKTVRLSNDQIIQVIDSDKDLEDTSVHDENRDRELPSSQFEVESSAHLDDPEQIAEVPLYEIFLPEEEIDGPILVKSEVVWDIANIPMEEDSNEADRDSSVIPKSELLDECFSLDEYEENSEGSFHEDVIESMCDDLEEKAHSFGIDEELSIALEKYRERIQNAKSRGQLLDFLHSSLN